MSGRIIKSITEILALIIEMAPSRLSREDVEKALGSNPVLPKYLGEGGSHMAPPPGVPEEHYCLDCASKHASTAKILVREALQRAEGGEGVDLILAKVRGAYEELTGAEDDTQALSDEGIRALNSRIRELRKWMFDSGLLVEPSKDKIAEAYNRISALNDAVYGELEKRKAKLREFIGKVEERLQEIKKNL